MCESKVQAWVKPSASARLVSSTTRQAGGLVCRVTPKSMSASSILPGARYGGGRAEGYVDPAGDVALPAPYPRVLVAAPEPVRGGAREQGVETVGAESEYDEGDAEQGYLRRDHATRGVDELRQEGQEEERGLGVEHVDDHALGEHAR